MLIYSFKFGLTFLTKNLTTLSLILDFVLMLDYFVIIVIGDDCQILFMAIRCEQHIAILLLQVKHQIELLSMMFDISISLLRCLCWCGASFVIDFLLKTTWCIRVFFLQMTWCVLQGVIISNQLHICFYIATSSVTSGLMCGNDQVFHRYLLVIFDNILFSLPIWRVCQDFLIYI